VKGKSKMARYKTIGGIDIDAHVVTAEEKILQLPGPGGIEWLHPGDAAVTLDKQTFKVPGVLFALLFEPTKAEPKGPAKAKEHADPKEPK
jgi:hypothetical protein